MAGTPRSPNIPSEFLSNTYGFGTSPFCISTPTRLDRCGFFFFLFIFFKILFINFQSEGKRRRKTRRKTSMCGCLSCSPYWGPGLQPRHVPRLGIKLVTLWCTACTQSTKLYQPGGCGFLILYLSDFHSTQFLMVLSDGCSIT